MAKLVHSVRLSIPHVDRVRTPCTIQRPDPRADRARPQRLTTIALTAWGAGVLLTLGLARMHGGVSEMQRLSMSAALGQLRPAEPEPERLAIADQRRDRAEQSSRPITNPVAEQSSRPIAYPVAEQSSRPIAYPVAEQSSRPVHQTRAQATTPVPSVAYAGQAALPQPKPVASNPVPAVEAPQGAGRRRAKRVFEQGTVAYIRCGGAAHTRAPCLRDRKFEEQVWQTLAKLSSCSEADPGNGSAELRWTMYKTDQTAFDWRSGLDGTSLNLRAVAKCAGEKLANIRTRLRAQQAVVSFRFSLK